MEATPRSYTPRIGLLDKFNVLPHSERGWYLSSLSHPVRYTDTRADQLWMSTINKRHRPDSNLGPIACEAGALTSEPLTPQKYGRLLCAYELQFTNRSKRLPTLIPQTWACRPTPLVGWPGKQNSYKKSYSTYLLGLDSWGCSCPRPLQFFVLLKIKNKNKN